MDSERTAGEALIQRMLQYASSIVRAFVRDYRDARLTEDADFFKKVDYNDLVASELGLTNQFIVALAKAFRDDTQADLDVKKGIHLQVDQSTHESRYGHDFHLSYTIITQIRISYIIGKEKVKFQWELLRNCVVEHTLCGKDSSNERHIALYAVYAPAEVYFVPVGRLQEKITWTDNNKTLSASLLYGSDDTSEKNVLVDDAGMCNLLQKLENKEMGLEGLFGGEEYYTVLKNLNTKWRAIFGITEEES
ncbi:unnamed protein product [Somion occarium]|uniref:Uncharacterized protein n=1 Tax=Somion occarium TaxID=3059160 RepID=A0ABP1D687_9APHY